MSFRGYEAVIGIEIHVQLSTQSKIFSSDATAFDASDNENTSPVSVGMPGSLPVLNKKVIEYAIKTGLALGCEIRNHSTFSRKNYFYPDLPKGYQISQYDKPICENGRLTFTVDGEEKTIRITRAHIEEDAGKSTHHGEYTLVNYNRAGVPLLEVVSAPDLRTPKEAAEYCRTIRQIVRYLNVCDGNLEEGSLRCDCNVSIRKVSDNHLGTRVEIKNLNSFRFVEKAIEYEIDRQIDASERGEKIIQETRLWDTDKNRTFTMRTKEDAQDYRYFPDPDLLPIAILESQIAEYRDEIPELPLARSRRFMLEHGLPEYDAHVLTNEKPMADFYEATALNSKNYKVTSNWIMTEVIRELNLAQKEIDQCPVSPENLGRLIFKIDRAEISGKMAKVIFQEMWRTGLSPDSIIKNMGLAQISDRAAIEKIIDKVFDENQGAVLEFKSGKKKNLFGFFVGAVMKESRGQANPDIVNQILQEKLK
jgi:aspartyl-tRNA(Asn)/glutamyl-tRNA(Gln) amidotransferase subunit B